ncbi:MAG: tetratricopeptide repeat protein [Promethearchaeota archaeon]
MPKKYRTPLEQSLITCGGIVIFTVILGIIWVIWNNLGPAIAWIVIISIILVPSLVYYYFKIYSKKIRKKVNMEKFEKYYIIGMNNAEQGKVNKAIKNIEKGLRYNPNAPDALQEVGILCIKRGEMEKALKYYGEAINLDSQNNELRSEYERLIRAIRKASDFFLRIDYDSIEKMKLLKCLRCGSRKNLLATKFSHRFTESDGATAPGQSETIIKGVESVIIPFCEDCNNLTPVFSNYVKFDRMHQPLVNFKGTGKFIHYRDWIAQIFYQKDIPNFREE